MCGCDAHCVTVIIRVRGLRMWDHPYAVYFNVSAESRIEFLIWD